MDNFIIQEWVVLVVTALIVFAVVFAMHWFLIIKQKALTAEKRLPRQLAMLGATVVAIIAIVLALPVNESSRNQLLGLFGVLLSGVIAFSSTTIVSNLMSGLVLRLNKPFKVGDFIKCNGYEGRVTEKGVLDTEIQTRQRDLVHIANSYLITNPVEVICNSGTLVSAEVSIGYNVHHTTVEKYLKKAALKAGLSDSFVHITELGNFSVSYKVSGMLEDTKSMLTTQSLLFAAILDVLHLHNIEIMSPSMLATRAVDPSQTFIAKDKVTKATELVNQEDLVFDKAAKAEKNETQLLEIQEKIASLKVSLSQTEKDGTKGKVLSDKQKAAAQVKLEALEAKLSALNSKK